MTTNALMSASYAAIAQSLRDFGYPDVTARMVEDTHGAMQRGEQLPHGIIGMFAARQLKDLGLTKERDE